MNVVVNTISQRHYYYCDTLDLCVGLVRDMARSVLGQTHLHEGSYLRHHDHYWDGQLVAVVGESQCIGSLLMPQLPPSFSAPVISAVIEGISVCV